MTELLKEGAVVEPNGDGRWKVTIHYRGEQDVVIISHEQATGGCTVRSNKFGADIKIKPRASN